jgi:hypothetical protein
MPRVQKLSETYSRRGECSRAFVALNTLAAIQMTSQSPRVRSRPQSPQARRCPCHSAYEVEKLVRDNARQLIPEPQRFVRTTSRRLAMFA